MLLMNPMFASSGKTRSSNVAMGQGGAGRMSFLSNPLFDTSDDNVDIPDSPNASDSEAELLGKFAFEIRMDYWYLWKTHF